MVVCSCVVVSDRTVDAAIAAGASTVEDIATGCAAGSRCGGCRPMLEQLLAEGIQRRGRARTATAA
jgi:bacterioferritin-associated ferredoxin